MAASISHALRRLGLVIAGNIQAVVIGPSQTWQRIVAWLAR